MNDDLVVEMPEGYYDYLRKHGKHFSRGLCEMAVGLMKKEDGEKIQAMTKKEVERMLEDAGVKVEGAREWDAVYVANMGLADYLGESVPDMAHLAKYVKNVIDDADGYEGVAFCRWFADMCEKRVEVKWEELM